MQRHLDIGHPIYRKIVLSTHGLWSLGPALLKEHTFHTQRAPDSTFTFTVQADSHLGTPDHCNPALYRQTLQNAIKDRPDFHIDLGDTFRSTHLRTVNYNVVEGLYLAQRPFFGILCADAPLFLALGNHEAEWGWELDGTPENVPVWSTKARKLYYTNPFPDGFYTGSSKGEEFVGLRENYYAWEWGDALFVVLDPYWYTKKYAGSFKPQWSDKKASLDMWDRTIGDEQYKWFKQTLEKSDAKFKFDEVVKSPESRHPGAGRDPEAPENTGFRPAPE